MARRTNREERRFIKATSILGPLYRVDGPPTKPLLEQPWLSPGCASRLRGARLLREDAHPSTPAAWKTRVVLSVYKTRFTSLPTDEFAELSEDDILGGDQRTGTPSDRTKVASSAANEFRAITWTQQRSWVAIFAPSPHHQTNTSIIEPAPYESLSAIESACSACPAVPGESSPARPRYSSGLFMTCLCAYPNGNRNPDSVFTQR